MFSVLVSFSSTGLSDLTYKQLISNITLTSHWVIPFYNQINGVSWFVSVLWFQYLVFPYTVCFHKNMKRKLLAVCIYSVLIMFLSTVIIMKSKDFRKSTMNIFSPGFFAFHIGMVCGFWCKEKALGLLKKSTIIGLTTAVTWRFTQIIIELLWFSFF